MKPTIASRSNGPLAIVFEQIRRKIHELDADKTNATALTSRQAVVVSHEEITGAWAGSVARYCDVRLASQLAAVFFKTCPASITVEMIAAARGEIINMIGGHFVLAANHVDQRTLLG